MTAWRGQMSAAQSRLYAEHVVIPAILPKMGIDGRIEAVELHNDQIAKTLDIVGGIDYWIRTGDNRLITIASRNQWYYDDGVNRDSFTIRVDIGGSRTGAWCPTGHFRATSLLSIVCITLARFRRVTYSTRLSRRPTIRASL
jgi:hypothetical protein